MALPKSTFVMGVVTLGLFGVAIYETAGKKGGSDRKHLEDEEDSYEGDEGEGDEAVEELSARERAKAYEREQRRMAEERAQEEALEQHKAALKQLFDAEIALPGPLFRGVPLDGTELTDKNFPILLDHYKDENRASVTTGSIRRFDRFEIRPGAFATSTEREALCDELHTQLGTAWGSAYVDDDGVELWTNKVAGTRASFLPTPRCELVFEKYDEPAAWIHKSGTSTIPLGWVGKPAAFVEKAVGTTVDGEVITWFAHGLGAGTEQTKLEARVANGKISHIVASTKVNTPTRAALEDHLRTEFGRPKPDQTGSIDARLDWPARKLAVVLGDDGTITVTIGTP